MSRLWSAGVARLRRYPAELTTSGAAVAGWCCLTAGVARLTSPAVWWLSAGFFLLSLTGWRLLWQIAKDGLYRLTRPEAK